MAPSLVKQWRKYSAKHSDPPPLEDLRKFLGEQIKATPEALSVKKEKDSAPKPKIHLNLEQGLFSTHRLQISVLCVPLTIFSFYVHSFETKLHSRGKKLWTMLECVSTASVQDTRLTNAPAPNDARSVQDDIIL